MDRRHFLTASLAAGIAPRLPAQDIPGGMLQPGMPGYEAARRPFNTCITLRPAFILPCKSEQDVIRGIGFARDRGLAVSIKGGGHCFTGSSLNEGGLVLDLSGMRTSALDKDSNQYTAGPGLRLGEVYDHLIPQGRLLPAGSCSGVGIAGLTLGGGYGLFARQFGLTCDHMTGLRMVNGHGKLIDTDDDPELLWACRGGGNGNFGVVTSMRFHTQAAPSHFTAQRFIATKLSHANMQAWIRTWFELSDTLPDPMFSALVLNGTQATIMLTSTFPASGAAFARIAGAYRKAGASTKGAGSRPLADGIKRFYGRPDPLPFHNVSGGFYSGLASVESKLGSIVAAVQGNPGFIFQINTLGGAISRGPDSAYPHRQLPYLGEIQSYWEKEAQREKLTRAVIALRQELTESGIRTQYRNYPDLSLPDWENAYYGSAYGKLREVKRRHDPDNLIRHPQSVRP